MPRSQAAGGAGGRAGGAAAGGVGSASRPGAVPSSASRGEGGEARGSGKEEKRKRQTEHSEPRAKSIAGNGAVHAQAAISRWQTVLRSRCPELPCFVASFRCPAKGSQYLTLTAPEVGSCAARPWVYRSPAVAKPCGFGLGLVLLGVTAGAGGAWTCLAPRGYPQDVLKLTPGGFHRSLSLLLVLSCPGVTPGRAWGRTPFWGLPLPSPPFLKKLGLSLFCNSTGV